MNELLLRVWSIGLYVGVCDFEEKSGKRRLQKSGGTSHIAQRMLYCYTVRDTCLFAAFNSAALVRL